MSPLRRKVCLLGGFAVGKTSLVKRFVDSIFSDHYRTTIGVHIDKKALDVAGRTLTLMLWDLYGEDEFQTISPSFLRASDGCLLVADGTRRPTLEKALELAGRASELLGPVPMLLLVNKSDLASSWEIGPADLARATALSLSVLETSAKTGANVELAFTRLAEAMLARTPHRG
jgi:hypothetical protein